MSSYPTPIYPTAPIFNTSQYIYTPDATSGGSSTYVTISGAPQTISSFKTFATSPNLSSIINGSATLTIPSTTGTLALTSQIPTNSTYVDLASTQTVTGSKTFSTAPKLSSIINGSAILTLPSTTGTLALTSQIPTNSTYVDLSSTQTITGSKTWSGTNFFSAGVQYTGNVTVNYGGLSSFYIWAGASLTNYASLSYAGTNIISLTLPTSGGQLALTSDIPTNSTYVDLTSTQSITGSKTLSSATTSSLKIGANGTSVGQLLKGTGSVVFSSATQYQQVTTTITFSSAFSSTPTVFVQCTNGGSNQTAVIFAVSSVTTSGCTVNAFYTYTSTYSATVNFNWIAIA